ncbi:MAG: TolC family protein, partial [Nitrospira sp.]|nr:TolC family protein [Nitrospira sp.]
MWVVRALLLLVTVNVGSVGLAAMSVSSESGNQVYGLDTIVDLALAKNPVVSLAEGTIEQQKGQQTAAGAYPNPTVGGGGGHGMLRDTNRAGSGSSLDRQSLTEYNVVVGQPVEWPALRAARQRVADLGLATANVGMLETRLNLTSQVKVAFYDLLLAQQDADLAKQNLDTVEGVARIVKARVKSGEAPQFESIKAEVEVLKARQQLARADNLVRINRVAVD